MEELEVYTFSPGWGLPSMGPFALKLLAWLNIAGIPYRQRIEDRADRGPLGKSPWIVRGDLRMGDSDSIIRHLAAEHGMADPTTATTAAAAHDEMLKTAFEERFHQILEWELFIHSAGAAHMHDLITGMLPPVVGPLVARQMRRHFRRQLHARGIGRLPPEEIAATGHRLADALVLCLDARGGLLGQTAPTLADLAIWGQVAPLLCWPMDTPVARHIKAEPRLAQWHARILRHAFPER